MPQWFLKGQLGYKNDSYGVPLELEGNVIGSQGIFRAIYVSENLVVCEYV